jgi:hypothetical protein
VGVYSGVEPTWAAQTNSGRTHIATKGVDQTGLVLNLDAGVSSSYSGIGTSWTDLSSNNNSGELSIKDSFYKTYDFEVADYIIPNSPPSSLSIFSSSDYGTINFDGTQNYLNFSASSLGSTTSVEIWAKLGANYTNNTFLSFGNYTVWCGSGGLGYNTSNNDLYGLSSANVSTLGLVGNWKHYIFEMRSDVSYTNNKIYINGQNQTLSQQQGTELSTYRNFNNGSGRISSWQSIPGYEMPMNFALVRVYNTSLSQDQITKQFDVIRKRFGI